MLPRHPQLRSPSGSLSDNRQIIKPIRGVNSTERKNVQPKPILRLAPSSPTKAATKVSEIRPKSNNVKAIMIKIFAKI